MVGLGTWQFWRFIGHYREKSDKKMTNAIIMNIENNVRQMPPIQKKTSNMSSQPVGKTCLSYTFSALTLLVGRQEGHLACKKTEWWGAGVVICLEWVADLHMVQLMPVPLTVSCFSKIQIDFTFWYQLTRVIPDKGPLNRCVCVCVISVKVLKRKYHCHHPTNRVTAWKGTSKATTKTERLNQIK